MQDLLAVGGWAHGQTIAPQKNAAELNRQAALQSSGKIHEWSKFRR